VRELPIVEELAAIPATVRLMAGWLDQPARGEAVIADMAADLAALRAIALGATAGLAATAPSAAFYQPNGWTLGAHTLAGEVLEAAGFRNRAAELGLAGYRPLPLERLVMVRPDALVIGSSHVERPSIAEQILIHPALVAMPSRHLSIPSASLLCGTPAVVRAARALSLQRRDLAPLPDTAPLAPQGDHP
jgi:iron complex transport system substrate-binding protein